MAQARVGRTFAALMAASFASAFVIPPRFTTAARGPFVGAFAPVSLPVRWVAGAFYNRLHPAAMTDPISPTEPREAESVYVENARLRGALGVLQTRYDQLARLNADRQAVGDIRRLCRPATVTGFDASGLRDVILLGAAVPTRRPVVRGTNLVGRTAAAGLTGADVQLVSDPKFAVTGRIGRYVVGGDGQVRLQMVDHLPVVVQGVGNGTMAVRSTLTMAEVADLHVQARDVLVLDDPDWSPNLQGFTIGQVTGVAANPKAPLFANVMVRPVEKLQRLDEVMVVVRD